MRIVLGRGNRRQEWELSRADYENKRPTVNALLQHVGLIRR